MKLHFEANLDYQRDAIASVCDLFRGQESCRTDFTLSRSDEAIDIFGTSSGPGNSLVLTDEAILSNLRSVQLRNRIEVDSALRSRDFSVEMETGTGKTYVYLRTIFELHRRYDFTKFVIVVPSVAIKEGVHATVRASRDHFRDLYGTNARFFVYDSANLSDVRAFNTSTGIQVMLITVGAINKKENVLYQARETTGGDAPIDLIRSTRPILIVDEPQSVEGGLEGAGRAALQNMNAMCTLRYSATHDVKTLAYQHVIYRLTPVDAYHMGLVKQIEVASALVEGSHNRAYLKFLGAKRRRGNIVARVELDVERNGHAFRKELDLEHGDDLEEVTGRALYRGFRAGEIRMDENGLLELLTPQETLHLIPGQAHGEIASGALEREMIRRTIQEHLDKELRLNPLGIKVLSLFFIPTVSSYRLFDEAGIPIQGEYARMFEEEYQRFRVNPRYRILFPPEKSVEVEKVHAGYFAVDRKKIGGKTIETFRDSKEGRTTKADEGAYYLIMQAKERLLDLDNPLRFIFSHSALKEGWDNPNVFQICSLREMHSERQRRQTLGRGLRLCVNQQGDRVRGFDVNTLTVVANESYERYAEGLQSEIEEETRVRFGTVNPHAFAFLLVNPEDEESFLGDAASETIWNHLRGQGWISEQGQTLPALKKSLEEGSFHVPGDFKSHQAAIEGILKRLAARLPIRDADDRRVVTVRKEVLYGPDFQALWDRVKHRTAYQVSFDPEAFLQACIQAISDLPPMGKTRIQWKKASLEIDEAGVTTQETAQDSVVIKDHVPSLPDLLSALEAGTHLTRRSLVRILIASERLADFTRNPQEFIERFVSTLNRVKRRTLVHGIRYHRLAGKFYGQELLDTEVTGYLKNLVPARRSIYEDVQYDSGIEKAFVESLDRNEAVKVYVKLPRWFEIPTPVGAYNPDWAILLEKDGKERVYFVAETKSTLFEEERRGLENDKILCGKAHFEALQVEEERLGYAVTESVDQVIAYAFPD